MDKISAGLVVPVSSRAAVVRVYLDIMKNRKERRHTPKQANTLETSKKVLFQAMMNALHMGGFLFGKNERGAITPVMINATIQQMIVAILAFVFSRTANATETTELYDYVSATADRICKMRLKDVAAPEASSEGSEGSK